MKTKLILLALLISAYCNATVRTVNNNNPSPGQFTTFSAAQSAALAGDTIYFSGSPTTYTGISPTKQLTLIGTGHNPDKQNPLVSTIDLINVTSSSAAGSKFIGLKALLANGGAFANNLTYQNCFFSN